MNSVILIGRLTKDPELNYTPNTQTAVCSFNIAVDRPRRQGEDKKADFFRITVFGRQAESCNTYLSKGRQVAIHGRIETGSYKNREGVTVNTTDIIADNVEFIGGQQIADKPAESAPDPKKQLPEKTTQVDMDMFDLPDTFQTADDDIPF